MVFVIIDPGDGLVPRTLGSESRWPLIKSGGETPCCGTHVGCRSAEVLTREVFAVFEMLCEPFVVGSAPEDGGGCDLPVVWVGI